MIIGRRPRFRRAVGAVLIAAGVTAGTVACGTTVPGRAAPGQAATTNPSAPDSGPDIGPCKYLRTPRDPAPAGHRVGLPKDPFPTPNTGTVTVTFHTNDGDIPIVLNRAEAPCTVRSELFLIGARFYDDTPCHRLTAYSTPPLDVLQCGDPTGSGTGGPGYTIPDEYPKNLQPAPGAPGNGERAPDIYPAGAVAMANTGEPHSGGSQFFLVYGNSYLPPNYTIFGTMTPAGLAVVQAIAAHGITPGTMPDTGRSNPRDGKPASEVTITSVTR